MSNDVDVIGFIVNTIDPATVRTFVEGLRDRSTAAAVDTEDQATIDDLSDWVSQWFVSASLISDPEWRRADTVEPVGPPVSSVELRARVHARRRLAVPA